MGVHRLPGRRNHAMPAGAFTAAATRDLRDLRDLHHDGDASVSKPGGLTARELGYCSLRRPSTPREDVASPARGGGSRSGQMTPPLAGPAGPPPSPFQPRTQWSPTDGKLHVVFFRGVARAVCGHLIGRAQQSATPPDGDVCWACRFAGGRQQFEAATVLSGDPCA